MRLTAILLLGFGFATGSSACAQGAETASCPGVWPEEFPVGQPFVLNDPRSGLTLSVEKDGRHMVATTRQGTVIWHRDLFSDPNLYKLFPQPPPIPGVSSESEKEWTQRMKAYVAGLTIDRIGIEPDCVLPFIDHVYPAQLHGHYIRAGSGTHIFWLLDANTGDFQIEEVN